MNLPKNEAALGTKTEAAYKKNMNHDDSPQLSDSQAPVWLEPLQSLCARFSYLGIGADIAALSLIELWGLYLMLSRMAEGSCYATS